MESNKDFVKSDLIAANNFAKIAHRENLENIVYLGGLADESAELSEHLKSRFSALSKAPLSAIVTIL